MTPSEYLDATKEKLGVESDYAMAQTLDLHRATLNEMRSGKRPVSNIIAVKIAAILEMNPTQIIADLESQREKNAERREFWENYMKRLGGIAASFFGVVFVMQQGFEKAIQLAMLSP